MYLVKIKHDDETDLIIDNEEHRRALCAACDNVTDLYELDLMFNYLKYDFYINYLLRHKKQLHARNQTYNKELVDKVCSVLQSEEVRRVLFMLLDIEEDITLQQRYLTLMTKCFRVNISRNIKAYTPVDSIVERLVTNYIKVIQTTGTYKNLVKYIDNNDVDIYIYSAKVRANILERMGSQLTDLFEFEDKDLKVIATFLYDNYIKRKTARKSFVTKKYIENIIYNDEVILDNIKTLLFKDVPTQKYTKLLIDKIYSMYFIEH